jgi:diguanylate cyclase (GGDEF)-like protein
MSKVKHFIVKHTISIVFLYITAISILFLLGSNAYKEMIYKRITQDIAMVYSDTLSSLHEFYSTNILPNAKNAGIEVSTDYLNTPDKLPFPITFSNSFGNHLSNDIPGLYVDIYSNYPFENKKQRQLTPFAIDALDKLSKGESSYILTYEKGYLEESDLVRLAKPIYMNKTCLSCHNTEEYNLGRKWKEGEFRGIREIILPVPKKDQLSEKILFIGFILALFAALSGVLLILPLVKNLKASLNQTEKLAIKLKYQANHDCLTKVANLNYLITLIEESLKMGSKTEQIGLIFIDLDKFKPINDQYGHAAGDAILCHVSSLIEKVIKDKAILARIGGDEFVLLISTISTDSEMISMVNSIQTALTKPLKYKNNTLTVSASFGGVIQEKDHTTVDDLLKSADKAMYASKNSKHNYFTLYEENND